MTLGVVPSQSNQGSMEQVQKETAGALDQSRGPDADDDRN